jgi:hypothetical protein
MRLQDSNTLFMRTRLTFGLVHRFSESKKIGFYYRQGINSSDQKYQGQLEQQSQIGSMTQYDSSFISGKTNISTLSSEIGARFRASLTKRLFYGVEGAYLYERINSRHEAPDQFIAHDRYMARRARLGGGMGFTPISRVLLNIDVGWGVFNNDQPDAPPVTLGGITILTSYPGLLDSRRGMLVSANTAAQANLWRNLFLSFSSLYTFRKDLLRQSYGFETKEARLLSTGSLGWKFTPNLTAEYLFSFDNRYLVPSHSIMLRYTFNLGITGEK